MSIVRRAATNVMERRGADPLLPWGDSTPPTNGSLAVPAAGVPINDKSVLGIAAFYACAGILADAIATLPLRQYRGSTIASKTEVEPSPLVEQPCPDMTQQEWLTQGAVSLLLRGNFYNVVADRDSRGMPSALVPVNPAGVSVKFNQSGQLEYRASGKLVDRDDVSHIKGLQMPGAPVGVNPIELCRTTFGLARAAELYAAQFFANSAIPGGVITVEGDLSTEETVALGRQWQQLHQGPALAGLPAVLTGGATWQQVTVAPDDAQWIQTRGLSKADVGMICRIPPHMIGDVDRTTSWGTGIEQQELGFVRNTLLGYLMRFEHALSAYLPPGQYVKFDLRARLRGDTLQRFQAYTLARTGSWMNADEIRDLEEMPPIPDGLGQDYLAPMNMAPLGSAAAAAVSSAGTPPAPPAPPEGPSDD